MSYAKKNVTDFENVGTSLENFDLYVTK